VTRDHRFAGFGLLTAAIVLIGSSVGARIMRNTIGDSAALIGGGHAVEATVLLECDAAGQQVQFTLTLTQNGVSATGHGAGVCSGALEAYEVTVPAGGEPFTAGPAEACATAENYRRGRLDDAKQWCRAGGVTLF
jgi:hypothetical protein